MSSAVSQTSSMAIHNLLSKALPRAFSILRPPPKLTISEWADRYRVLSSEVSAESGKWQTSRAEYQREIMNAITDPLVEEITVMKCARSGGTQAAINNPLGYWVTQDPGPVLVIQPGLKEAREWSKDHWDPMVRDCQPLRELVGPDRTKDKSNEILHKKFPGGILYIIGANSAAGFRQKTIQRALLDDVDAYELSAGGEGDPITLARKRTQTYLFHHRKIIKISNPTTRGFSIIEREFYKSDQRHYYVPCPECQHFQLLLFSPESQFAHLGTSYLRFDTSNLSYVYYECENCKAKLDEKHKLRMVREGEWRKQQPTVEGHAGFHISELISPFSTWKTMAEDFLNAKRSRESLRVFINQALGETFIEDKTLEINDDELAKRIENYEAVPHNSLVLTAGVDVQHDRLEVIVLGWGRGHENWFIDHRFIIGSPDRDSTWKELDEYLATNWKHESGMTLSPWTSHGLNAVCIDSGYSAENVYRYVKKRQSRRFYATKGDEGFKKPFIINMHYKNKHNARLAILGVDALKMRIYDRLNVDRNPDGTYPAGYMHFNQHCNEDFFSQLTAEHRIVVRDKRTGATKWIWVVRENRRNEIFDCYVLNWAAITLLNPDFNALQQKMSEKTNIPMDDATPVHQRATKQTAGHKRQRRNPVTNW